MCLPAAVVAVGSGGGGEETRTAPPAADDEGVAIAAIDAMWPRSFSIVARSVDRQNRSSASRALASMPPRDEPLSPVGD
tara:strand:+ start:372 stop:608 length:237 start_codon:yes stop_codon:yes gene_type:complete